ncbi:MAG: iron-containing alcohol dehydrogenase family protein [Haloarculaceae archaeon]
MQPPIAAPAPFDFSYRPGRIAFGSGAAADLDGVVADTGAEGALVVTGETVAVTPAVIDPVSAGLGDRLAGVAAETTPAKRLASAAAVADTVRETGADALLALGGGSSLDVAKVASVLAASDESLDAHAAHLARTGSLSIPEGPLAPIVAVPTTLAGADLSQGAGIAAGPESGLEEHAAGGCSDPRLFPAAVVADPQLVATTPPDILAASAMNGFDKGIETLYAPTATPITDATAGWGLQYLTGSLPQLRGGADLPTCARALAGTLLVQYGVSRPDATTLSLVHAVGHGLRTVADVHQGRAHGAVVPHVLRYVFAEAGGRRDVLAGALGVEPEERTPDSLAEGVVDAVRAVRDSLDLPQRLATLSGLDRAALPDVAAAVMADPLVENAPAGVDVTRADVQDTLEAAW